MIRISKYNLVSMAQVSFLGWVVKLFFNFASRNERRTVFVFHNSKNMY